MKRMRYFFVLLGLFVGFTVHALNGTRKLETDTVLVLKNPVASVTVSFFGGAVIGFRFNDLPINPLSWKTEPKDMPKNNQKGAPWQGHFIGIGGWGRTSNEQMNNLPAYGEASNIWWKSKVDGLQIEMEVEAPMEQYSVHRTVKMAKKSPVFQVEELFTNHQQSDRLITVLQHATVGIPFLDSLSIMNCNAASGYNEELPVKSNEYEYKWPTGYINTSKTEIDLSKTNHKTGFVSTHIIDDSLGWASTASISSGFLIGYIWEKDDYPFLHVWHGVKDGRLIARGMEFSSHGFGDKNRYESVALKMLNGQERSNYVSPGSSISKKYTCFLMKIPIGFIGVDDISMDKKRITVRYKYKDGVAVTHLIR